MKRKWRVKSQLERDLENPAYRKRFEEDYEAFKVEVQLLLALERKHWSYSDLARAVGTQKSHISRDLKGGGIQSASLARIARMAEALGMKFLPIMINRNQEKTILPKLQKLVTA